MDLTLTASEEAFAAEVRSWLAEHVEHPGPFGSVDEEVDWGRSWQATLAAARMVAISWPESVGGRDASPVEVALYNMEYARAGAPQPINRVGISHVGPTLLARGTVQQQQRWMPAILDASEIWCQLFSEPDAGSDLAALRTRAEPTDGGWRVSGQKVWTSYAQFADWGLCLARTEPRLPKREGISVFMVDMSSPGIEVRPLRQITDDFEFNEVFFHKVFVADDQLVGEENAGWSVSQSTLAHERGTNPRQLVIHSQLLEELVRLAERSGIGSDPRTASRLAQAFVELRIFQLQNWRALSRLQSGSAPGGETTTAKLYWSEMSQRFHATAMRVLADVAPLWKGATGNPGDGRWQRSWLYYRAASIFAGTSEIQRTIIGERTLGLPRERRG